MNSQSDILTLPARLKATNALRTILCLVVVILVVLFLSLVFGRTGERIATQMCVNIAAVVALSIYCGNTGIVSFGHGSFMLIGAYLSGILTMPAALQKTALPQLPTFLSGHELDIWISLPIVLIAGLAFAAVTGTAISRLAAASATIATLGLLIIVHGVAVGARELTRGSQTFYGVPRETDLPLAMAAALAFVIVARLFRESRFGLFARAARDDADAASALGINPIKTRYVSWCLSGSLLTVAGALYGHMLGAFSPASFYLSLVFAHVAMMIVGGMASVTGAVSGVIVVTFLQDTVRQFEGGAVWWGIELPEVFGLTTVILGLIILLIIRLRPQGLVGNHEVGPSVDSRFFGNVSKPLKSSVRVQIPEETVLSCKGLSKNFSGVKAVSDVSFSAPSNRITGLIGPNGAGKSTLVNLLTRQYHTDCGEIHFSEREITHKSREQIARLGLSRSFQNIRMFQGLTAYENVLVGAFSSGLNRRESEQATVRELVEFDLEPVATMHANELPYGAQKRLEIARALSQAPTMLLLDEPAAGMNPTETEDLADRLEQLGKKRGTGILLIDHDLKFINRLSDWIVVMNRGQIIAEGTPDQVKANPAVIEAYIGKGRTANLANKRVNNEELTNGENQ